MSLFKPNEMLCRSLSDHDTVIGVMLDGDNAIVSTRDGGEDWTVVKLYRSDGTKLHVRGNRTMPVSEINEETYYIVDKEVFKMICYPGSGD
jgi:hypothetical protein